MTRLIYLVGFLLLVGLLWSLCEPTPGIFGSATAPVAKGDLWTLIPE